MTTEAIHDPYATPRAVLKLQQEHLREQLAVFESEEAEYAEHLRKLSEGAALRRQQVADLDVALALLPPAPDVVPEVLALQPLDGVPGPTQTWATPAPPAT